jgi:murein DD-endopeptidase MepM/ murein hydrolase activator NlpD
MRSPRYSILIANRQTGSVRRLTFTRRPALIVASSLFAIPVLIGLGARGAAREELSALQAANASLQLENDSYKVATGELAQQISTLQGAMSELTDQATLDPSSRDAVNSLPALVKSRAMGGAPMLMPVDPNATPASNSAKSTPGTATASTLNILKDLLGALESRLDNVRTGVERQQALASATPSIWPVVGWLTSAFGARQDPLNGGADFHPGLDISADYGTPVKATADGTIETAGWQGDCGNMILLKHGYGMSTKYGHLSRIAVSAGQTVHRGDVIGYVGATGRTTGAHLHYEILMNGSRINPLNLLGAHR